MDPVHNPYSPGAGCPPPELAGRDKVISQAATALARIRIGNSAKSLLLVGLRGVGKTVLLEKIRADAESSGIYTIKMEAPEDRSLPALISPQLRLALLRLSKVEHAKDVAQRALRALAGFAKALKYKYNDIEVGFDFEPEPGLADNGDLEGDLGALLGQAGNAARNAGTALVIFIDELQYVKQEQFAALITALHKCAQENLPLALIGAGLPQLRALAGKAKSYAERLFDYPMIDKLNPEDATLAIVKPASEQGVQYTAEAVETIMRKTQGYPYFLQEWGKHSWDIAQESPISADDVANASSQAIAALDESFFRVRFDRLTPTEKRYIRAMAELGAGPHRSGDIAETLGRTSNSLGPIRSSLITKGMIWSPTYGDTAFTVPLFDEFMRRVMPWGSME